MKVKENQSIHFMRRMNFKNLVNMIHNFKAMQSFK